MLQDCPLCKLVEKANSGEGHCVAVTYGGKKAVVLREHLAAPSAEALQEAANLIEGYVGHDIRDVAGHWGMTAVRVDWLQQPKAKYGRGNKPT